jgi:hypothetical protein
VTDIRWDRDVPDGYVYYLNPATMYHGPDPVSVNVWPSDGWWHWRVMQGLTVVGHGECPNREAAVDAAAVVARGVE